MILRVTLFFLLLPLISMAIERPSTVHEVYLKGTDYELHVYRIYGKTPGATGLIIGGIQGDEPGGYLSADMYVDAGLEKGDLIIVPRANFKSIILFNRGVDGDMNRRFIEKKTLHEMDHVVEILQNLMAEADFFLHLHDGSGFYSPKYINKLKNPYKWGQSIIVDAEEYKCKGKILNLKDAALKVIEETNKKISNSLYHFNYFNTDTDNPNTPYKDMKKTATYYALKNYCIPSFGLETSKNLPNNEVKLLHKSYLIDEFLKIYGVISTKPNIILPKPVLKSVLIEIDNKTIKVNNYSTLTLEKGKRIKILDIVSNYSRGLTCDILGFNGLNDKDMEYYANNSTAIQCKKDNILIGKINVKVNENKSFFYITVDNKQIEVPTNGQIKVKYGSTITLGNFNNDPSIPVNLRGFVPKNIRINEGDDRKIPIKITKNSFMRRYARQNGNSFEIIAGTLDNILGSFFLTIDND